MRSRNLIAALLLSVPALVVADARATVLYDGSLGTSPTAQGLLYAALPPVNYYTIDATGTVLNTSASTSTFAGFSNATAVPLDRSVGFTVSVNLQVQASAETNTSRAGWSIIALGSDKLGIELGFHDDEIFAQDDGANLFVRDESVAYDTTASVKRYDLTVLGNTYTLSANGTQILTGPVRDYTPFVGPLDPYETPNFLFFGDDSTSASGTTRFERIEVVTPEPATIGIAAASLLLARRKRI